MQSLLGAGVLVMVLADTVVGARLLGLARRTREVPELALGASFLLLGTLGYPLSIVARRGLAGERASALLLVAALFAQNLACLCVYVSSWRVFRPERKWAAGGVAVAALAFGASLVGTGTQDGGGWYYLGFAARAGSFLWASFESFRYYALLRRRLAIGLADPVVADRFRLWGIATSAIFAAFMIFLWGRLDSANVAESAPVLAATSLVGLVAGVTIWLAFFPPAAYTARVARFRASG